MAVEDEEAAGFFCWAVLYLLAPLLVLEDVKEPAGAPSMAPPSQTAGEWILPAATAPAATLPLLLIGTLSDLEARRL